MASEDYDFTVDDDGTLTFSDFGSGYASGDATNYDVGSVDVDSVPWYDSFGALNFPEFGSGYASGDDTNYDIGSLDVSSVPWYDSSGALNLDGYITNPDGSFTPYGFDKGHYGEGESTGVDESGMQYWQQPDNSILYSKYVDEQGNERNPDGTPTGRTIADIVGKDNVTVPAGQIPSMPNVASGSIKQAIEQARNVVSPGGVQPGYGGVTEAAKNLITGGGAGGGVQQQQQQQPQQSNWMQMLMMMLLLSQMNKGKSSSGASSAVIPQLTAKREQTPASTQRPAGYRPGQGGVTYFQPTQYAAAGGAMGAGIGGLGQYAAGGKGRLVSGTGDGVSDDIPATIDGVQPARIARGEYVIPARVVAELGNGSTDAGAERLDDMVSRIERAGRKADRGADSKAYHHIPN